MNGFVPGALCLCVSRIEGIAGRTCRLLFSPPVGEDFFTPDGAIWVNTGKNGTTWVCEFDEPVYKHSGEANKRLPKTKYVQFVQRVLIPLSGDTTQFEQEQEKEIANG